MINTNEKIKSLYSGLREKILSLSKDIQVKPDKRHIAFINNKNFADVVIMKTSIDVYLNLKSGSLDDPKNLARDVSGIGHWGDGDYLLKISNSLEFDYILFLIRQSFEYN